MEDLHSTLPLLRVVANACVMSSRVAEEILELFVAGPTNTSVEPLCSNSLAPSWFSLALDTSDRTQFDGNRSSMASSTPMVCVVLTRMQVWFGVTTESMTEARS